MSVSLEDVAKETLLDYGRTASYQEIWEVTKRHGLNDEDGTLADRVLELVSRATIRVRINP